MPFDRPTLATLVSRAQADIESRLQGTDAALRRSLAGVLARMDAGLVHGLYGYLEWIALQVMPDTAELEHLERWASIWGVGRKAASAATGVVTCAGTAGAVLPLGTLFQRADGTQYAATADVPFAGSAAGVPVRAATAGSAGNMDAGGTLQLVSPVQGVTAQGTAAAGLTGGADEETDAAFRTRLLARIRNAPHGGDASDYETWALEVSGVTRAWCSPREMGAGTVTVRFMMDATYADGIPTADDVARVKAHIDANRPVTAEVFVAAPVPMPLDAHAVITPDTPAVRIAVEASWRAAIIRDAVPGGSIFVSRLREALSVAAGEYDNALLAPTADVVVATGQIVVPGTLTWGDA